MQNDLDWAGTFRIVCAILEQAYVDMGSHRKEDRDHAKSFIESSAFNVCCQALRLNEKSIRRKSLEIYNAIEKIHNDNRAKKSKRKRSKRQPAAKKYKLE
jgi:hypothetical protein